MDKRIKAGPGISVMEITGRGAATIVSARRGAVMSAMAWEVGYGGDYITVGYGTVNEREPRFEGKLISGERGKDGVVRLTKIPLPKDGWDSEGRQWLVLMVITGGKDKDGKEAEVPVVKFMGRAGDLDFPENENMGICPLAVIKKGGAVHQIEYFHLRYRKSGKVLSDGSGRVYHLFWS